MPHPYLVPFMSIVSRRIQRSGMSSGTSTVLGVPLSVKEIFIGRRGLGRVGDYQAGTAAIYERGRGSVIGSGNGRESGNPEVAVQGENLRDATLAHNLKAHSVRQAEVDVRELPEPAIGSRTM